MIRPPRFTSARKSRLVVVCASWAASWMLACSSGPSQPGLGTGGGQGGGATSTGGSSPGTGGTSGGASGGTTTGGTGPSTGGMKASGGHAGAGATGGGVAGSSGASGSVAGGSGHAGASGGQWSSTFPTFVKHTIATFNSGYSIGVADVDHDGKLDVVALSSASGGLVWFKGPSWTKYTITSKAKQLIYMSPYDVDGDGDLDFAVISDFSMSTTAGGGTISWAEAPADPTKNQEWDLHKIDAIPTAHRVRWADLDGNGKKELLVLPLYGADEMSPVKFTAYTIPQDPKAGTWAAKIIDDQHLPVSHALEIVDWDGDKAEDVLTGSNDGVDLFRLALGPNAQRLGAGKDGTAPNKGSSEVALGTLGGMRFFATIEPWHGTDTVIYTPGATASDLWTRQDLGADLMHGHGMKAADFNGDGFDDVVAGGGQGDMVQLIYRYVPSTKTWDKMTLDKGGVAVSGIDVGDLDGDGDIDIVSIGGSPTNNVVWYENTK